MVKSRRWLSTSFAKKIYRKFGWFRLKPLYFTRKIPQRIVSLWLYFQLSVNTVLIRNIYSIHNKLLTNCHIILQLIELPPLPLITVFSIMGWALTQQGDSRERSVTNKSRLNQKTNIYFCKKDVYYTIRNVCFKKAFKAFGLRRFHKNLESLANFKIVKYLSLVTWLHNMFCWMRIKDPAHGYFVSFPF